MQKTAFSRRVPTGIHSLTFFHQTNVFQLLLAAGRKRSPFPAAGPHMSSLRAHAGLQGVSSSRGTAAQLSSSLEKTRISSCSCARCKAGRLPSAQGLPHAVIPGVPIRPMQCFLAPARQHAAAADALPRRRAVGPHLCGGGWDAAGDPHPHRGVIPAGCQQVGVCSSLPYTYC